MEYEAFDNTIVFIRKLKSDDYEFYIDHFKRYIKAIQTIINSYINNDKSCAEYFDYNSRYSSDFRRSIFEILKYYYGILGYRITNDDHYQNENGFFKINIYW